MGEQQATETPLEERTHFVADTSFVYGILKSSAWSQIAQRHIKEKPVEVTVPNGVENELLKHYVNRETQNGIPLLSEKPDVKKILGVEEYRRYEHFWSWGDGSDAAKDIRFDVNLSRTDKSVIVATLDFAKNRQKVAVGTADRGIVDSVQKISDAEGFDVEIFSPWTKSLAEISSALKLDFLVRGNVFLELYAQDAFDGKSRYLCVAKNISLRGQGIYDIIFTTLVRDSITDKLPQFNGVEVIPIVALMYEGGKIKTRKDYLKAFTSPRSVFYSPSYPNSLTMVKLQEPLKQHRLVELLAREKNERGIRKTEIEDMVKSLGKTAMPWARINRVLLNGIDQEAVRHLAYLNKEIEEYRH